MDVDFFTKDLSPENFAQAVDELTIAYEGQGLIVNVLNRTPLFVNFDVLDPITGQGLGKVVVSGVWLGVMGAWSLWILG